MKGTLPYFPKISFFLKAAQSGSIQVQPDITYNKRLQLNRTVIPGSNGLIKLSIPILGGRNIKVRQDELIIDNRYHWQRDHFRTISSVYRRSPFYIFYEDELKALYETKVEGLMEWNFICLHWILQKLKCSEKLIVNRLSEVDICQNSEADEYSSNIMEIKIYPQVFQTEIGFQSDVSILDILFNLDTHNGLKIIGLAS
jgi:hypothetical protein